MDGGGGGGTVGGRGGEINVEGVDVKTEWKCSGSKGGRS